MLITSPAFAIIGLALNLQTAVAQASQAPRNDSGQSRPRVVAAPTDTSATAVRADASISIDGKDDDAAWRIAPPITQFQEWRPNEGKAARFKTEAKIVYDAANLYVFVRAFDPHPDSIKKILERRDTFTSSDMIWIFVDSYHDKRTGYEFGVNAAGVKMDQAIYDDGNEDGAWDAVWDVATHIDSLGWTAEFRIPLSQMRYSRDKEHTFGIMIDRDVYRYNERYIWPLLRQSKPGFASWRASPASGRSSTARPGTTRHPGGGTRRCTSSTGRARTSAAGPTRGGRTSSSTTCSRPERPHRCSW